MVHLVRITHDTYINPRHVQSVVQKGHQVRVRVGTEFFHFNATVEQFYDLLHPTVEIAE